MYNNELESVCGINCSSCDYFGKQCQGCHILKGNPFWVSSMNLNACPIYDCCVNVKHLEHCGFCGELPCKIFLELRDPSLTDEEFDKSLQMRQTNLLKRKEIGTY